MNHGSLFSGIGGFDLAAEWMGWENKFHCEWNPFGQKVLKHYWPQAESYHDITKTDFNIWRNRIDILTGGFPCQPYSLAGKRKGKEDDRHLWPEMLRAITEIQPRWVVGENVFGLVNWNDGLVFHEVQSDLEAEGYEVFPYVLPAVSVNAPHRRDRIWFIAYNATNSNSIRQHGSISQYEINASEGREYAQRDIEQMGESNVIDSIGIGRDTSRDERGYVANREREWQFGTTNCTSNGWRDFPTQSPVCHGNDGIPTGLDGITFSKWRQESIKAGGNAVVPQVVYQIFQAIEAYEQGFNSWTNH